ncbi:MAG: DEAD/DEAH box helicase, partial [Thermoplasmata archaeon]|nr:DEAD/DEAH box helicase [Thermoplasmata archaeon]
AQENQRTLGDFERGKKGALKVIADTREFNSSVVRFLSLSDVVVESVQLDIGDYLISDRVGIERKETDDLLASIMDGRLFQQARALKRAYQSPLMILEGPSPFGRGRLSAEAIYGALASITVDFGIPIISTKDDRETAKLILTIVKREVAEGRSPGIRGEKGTMLLQERQQFILEGLPNVSGVIAQRLLSHFGSVKAVMKASGKELQEVKGVGKKIAKGIRETLDAPYFSKERDE